MEVVSLLRTGKRLVLLIICGIFCLVNAYAQETLRAFPGAEGFGSGTIGGREGKIVYVTNLNDHGAGSLREAIEQDYPRVILFKINGLIDLENPLIIKNPFVTIYGNSSPGMGICLRGNGLSIETHDVVLRYLRIRPGAIDFGPENDWGGLDCLSIGGVEEHVYNIVIDHCSFSWGVDENIGIWGEAHEITIQNCIISESLTKSMHPKGIHGMGMLIGNQATNISIHHNLFYSNNSRNPLINGNSNVDFRNNYIYNPGSEATIITTGDGSYPVKEQNINYVGNVLHFGKSTRVTSMIYISSSSQRVLNLFYDNNIIVGKPEVEKNEALRIREWIKEIPKNTTFHEEFNFDYVMTSDPVLLINYMMEEVGSNSPLDELDTRVFENIIANKGTTIQTRNDPNDWPNYSARSLLPLDQDDDLLPDYWEEHYGLNTNLSSDDILDYDGDGYLNIEEFLNGTNPSQKEQFGELKSFSLVPNPIELEFGIEKIFPNPTQGSMKMLISNDESDFIAITLYTMSGSYLYQILDTHVPIGKYLIELDEASLRTGVNILSIVKRSGASINRKLIKL